MTITINRLTATVPELTPSWIKAAMDKTDARRISCPDAPGLYLRVSSDRETGSWNSTQVGSGNAKRLGLYPEMSVDEAVKALYEHRNPQPNDIQKLIRRRW